MGGWLSPMGTALRTWAWTQGEEALAEGEEEGEVLEGRRLILWEVVVGWVEVEDSRKMSITQWAAT